MHRFEVVRKSDCLTLTMPLADRMMAVGCALFGASIAVLAGLGLLGFVWEVNGGKEHTGLDTSQLFSPQGNHFGFLWLVGMAVLLALAPIYAWRAYHAAITFVFCRAGGRVLHNGHLVARMSRIDGVRVRRTTDPDDVPLHELVLMHGDGMELIMHASYDEHEIQGLAREIADFIGLKPSVARLSSIANEDRGTMGERG